MKQTNITEPAGCDFCDYILTHFDCWIYAQGFYCVSTKLLPDKCYTYRPICHNACWISEAFRCVEFVYDFCTTDRPTV